MSPLGRSRGPARRQGPDDGVVAVFVADEQASMAIDTTRWQRLAEDVLTAEGIGGEADLSVLFVDEGHIAELNRTFLGGTGPTDVLSFPIDGESYDSGRFPDGGTPGPDRSPVDLDDLPLLLGDVVICPTIAARNAPDHAGTLDDELALLLVHGILHLLGHDHAEPEERQRMQDAERRLLDAHWGELPRDPWAVVNAEAAAVDLRDGAPPTATDQVPPTTTDEVPPS